jgi:enoyl-CoA hydratase/carnithine racemase
MSEQISAMRSALRPFKDYQARHFHWGASADGRVATVRLNRPEKKNPLTFDSHAELRDLFRDLAHASDVRAIVLIGSGGNFCSGGDVFEIIEPRVWLGDSTTHCIRWMHSKVRRPPWPAPSQTAPGSLTA